MGEDDEGARLAALKGYGLLDSPGEPEFDAIVRDAALLLHAPVAMIALVDATRVWFKARVGIDAKQMPRALSYCSHTITGDAPMILPDTAADARFADPEGAWAKLGYRFYAGVPLIGYAGHRIGTLCVLDRVPRAAPEPATLAALQDLAARTMTLFESRRVRRLARERGLAA